MKDTHYVLTAGIAALTGLWQAGAPNCVLMIVGGLCAVYVVGEKALAVVKTMYGVK